MSFSLVSPFNTVVCLERLTEAYRLQLAYAGVRFAYLDTGWFMAITHRKNKPIRIKTSVRIDYNFDVNLFENHDGTTRITCIYKLWQSFYFWLILSPVIIAIPWPFLPDMIWKIGLALTLVFTLPFAIIFIMQCSTAKTCASDYICKALEAYPVE